MIELPTDPFDVPYRTVKDLLESRAEELGDTTLLCYGDQELSYAEINDRANAIANSLAKLGVGKGDRVATMLYNSPEHLCVWFGVAKLGAVFVPINVNVKSTGLAHIVDDSQCSIAIVEAETLENYVSARNEFDTIDHEFIIGDRMDGFGSFETLLEGNHSLRPHAEVDLTDPMSIIYTSGTTGLPKGVVLPHFSYINTGLRTTTGFELVDEVRMFTTLPLFHCNAQQATVMPTMLTGSSLAMERWFSATKFWDWIREYGATHFNFIGSILTALANQPATPEDDENPAILGVGAPVPEGYYELFRNRFGVELVEGYGLTETATSAARNPVDAVREGSFGKPYPHIEMSIVDELDRQLEPGEVGEIVVRSNIPYTMMTEYFGQPDKTVEAWRNLWFHTGDIGYRDEDGYFYFLDRKAHSIRRRGENISTAEVEQVIEQYPGVVEAAIIGVPSELGEEEVKAYIKTSESAEIQPLEVIRWCEERLAYFKIPRYIEFVEDFPKTPTERIRKTELKKQGIGEVWDVETSEYEISK